MVGAMERLISRQSQVLIAVHCLVLTDLDCDSFSNLSGSTFPEPRLRVFLEPDACTARHVRPAILFLVRERFRYNRTA